MYHAKEVYVCTKLIKILATVFSEIAYKTYIHTYIHIVRLIGEKIAHLKRQYS